MNVNNDNFYYMPEQPERLIPEELDPIVKVMEYAKWAPAGDNILPYNLEFLSDTKCVVHGKDTRDHVVYDLQGNASKLALGAMLATAKIAAGNYGYDLSCITIANRFGLTLEDLKYDHNPTFLLELSKINSKANNDLFDYIHFRTVQRKRMGTTPLTPVEIETLENSLPEGYKVVWKTSKAEKRQVAKLSFRNGYTRLNMQEGYEVHSKIVEYRSFKEDKSKVENNVFSKDKVPSKSLGLDWLNVQLMKWALKSWSRFDFLHSKLKGTLTPRVLLDYLPSIYCSGHFLIIAAKPARTLDDFIEAGEAVQKFWLTATKLKLGFQPQYTPISFHEYIRDNICFTQSQNTIDHAIIVNSEFSALFGEDNAEQAIYMGRLGRGSYPTSRSWRPTIQELTIDTVAIDTEQVKSS